MNNYAAVEKGRKNEIWRTAYMKERIIIMDAQSQKKLSVSVIGKT